MSSKWGRWGAWAALLCTGSLIAAPKDDLVAQQNMRIPKLVCVTEQSSREEALTYALVEKRVKEGQIFAAYADVLSLPASQAKSALLRADILRQLGRPEARSWYEALLKTCLAAQARHGLGQMSAASEDWSQAVKEFQRAVMLSPADARFRNDLGFSLMHQGDYAAAAFELSVASELDMSNRRTTMNLLLLAMVRGDNTLAEQLIVRWQPTRREFDDLLGDCARLLTQRHGIETVCPLRF